MAGRPPKPLLIHKVQGTTRKHRHAGRKDLDPADTAMPEPPDWLGIHGRKEWLRLLKDSQYVKALRAADFTALTTYCSMWDEFVRCQKKGQGVKPSFIATMVSLGGKLGLNPADRCKVRVPEEEKPRSSWSQFRTSSAG